MSVHSSWLVQIVASQWRRFVARQHARQPADGFRQPDDIESTVKYASAAAKMSLLVPQRHGPCEDCDERVPLQPRNAAANMQDNQHQHERRPGKALAAEASTIRSKEKSAFRDALIPPLAERPPDKDALAERRQPKAPRDILQRNGTKPNTDENRHGSALSQDTPGQIAKAAGLTVGKHSARHRIPAAAVAVTAAESASSPCKPGSTAGIKLHTIAKKSAADKQCLQRQDAKVLPELSSARSAIITGSDGKPALAPVQAASSKAGTSPLSKSRVNDKSEQSSARSASITGSAGKAALTPAQVASSKAGTSTLAESHVSDKAKSKASKQKVEGTERTARRRVVMSARISVTPATTGPPSLPSPGSTAVAAAAAASLRIMVHSLSPTAHAQTSSLLHHQGGCLGSPDAGQLSGPPHSVLSALLMPSQQQALRLLPGFEASGLPGTAHSLQEPDSRTALPKPSGSYQRDKDTPAPADSANMQKPSHDRTNMQFLLPANTSSRAMPHTNGLSNAASQQGHDHADHLAHELLSRHAGPHAANNSRNAPSNPGDCAVKDMTKCFPSSSQPADIQHQPASLTALLDEESCSWVRDPAAGLSPAGLQEKPAWQLEAELQLLMAGLRGFVEMLLRSRQHQQDACVLRARYSFLHLAASLQVCITSCVSFEHCPQPVKGITAYLCMHLLTASLSYSIFCAKGCQLVHSRQSKHG